MNGNFLNNKNLVLLIIVLLIIVGIGGVFYWQKTRISSDISPEAIKNKCLNEIDEFSDEQLIEKINGLSFLTGDELGIINRETMRYFTCKIEKDKMQFDKRIQKSLYQRITGLVSQLNILDETLNKILGNEFLGKLLYEYDEEGNQIGLVEDNFTFLNDIALKPLSEICPNGNETDDFLNTCLKSGYLHPENISRLSSEQSEQIELRKYNCNHFCEIFERYEEDPNIFMDSVNSFIWSDDFGILEKQVYQLVAGAFRVGGKDLALDICDSDSIQNEEIEERCKLYIDSIDYINCKEFGFNIEKSCQFNEYQECDDSYNNIKRLVCDAEVKKYNR